VTRLLVFRDDRVYQEMDIGFTTLRIGRGEDNDVILEDPTKAVSRIHAELRYSNGRYEILDLDSQNGIWIDGARVGRAVLESTTAISIGPYRLMVEETSDAMNSAHTAPAGRPAPREVTEELDERSDADTSSRRQPGWLEAHRKQLSLAGATVVVAAALGLTKLWTTHQGPSDAEILAGHLSQAKVLIEQGEPQRAIAEHLDPALAIDPANEDALNLKSRAEALAAQRSTPSREPPPRQDPPTDNPVPNTQPPPEVTREPQTGTGRSREVFVPCCRRMADSSAGLVKLWRAFVRASER